MSIVEIYGIASGRAHRQRFFIPHTPLWYKTLYNRSTCTLFLLSKKCSANFKSFIPTPSPSDLEPLSTTPSKCCCNVEAAFARCQSDHCPQSKWPLPAIEEAAISRLCICLCTPSLTAATAVACRCSHRLSRGFTCHCLLPQVLSSAITAAIDGSCSGRCLPLQWPLSTVSQLLSTATSSLAITARCP